MTYFFLSTIALFLGPLILRFAGERRHVLQFLDGLVLVSIGALVLGAFLPHAVESGGLWAVVAFIAGLVVPSLAEKARANGHAHDHDRVHVATVYIGMSALILHAMADGVAFADRGMAGQGALALAVLLHRLPVGLAVWWLVRNTHGRRGALAVLGLIAAATGIGYGLGVQVDIIHSAEFLLVLAFVAGSLFHVLMHQHAPAMLQTGGARYRWAAFFGGAVGLAAIVLAVDLGPEAHTNVMAHGGFFERFLHYALESAPALCLGYLLAGLVVYFLPTASVRWLAGGRRISQAARGVVFGLPLPVCSCGVVPLYDSLVRRGVPVTAGVAFLVATPELGIEAFLLSFPLLGIEMTMARLVAAALLAFSVALVVSRFVPADEGRAIEDSDPANIDKTDPLPRRVFQAIRYGFVDVLDDTAVWIVAGLGVAAFLSPDSVGPLLEGLSPLTEIVLCALIGIPMYVCASGATPMAAALIAAGLSPGAAITFLLSGPATNITTFGILSRLHGRSIAVAFAASVVSLAIVIGVTINAIWVWPPIPGVGETMGHGILGWIAFAVLSGAFLLSLARQGPRAFFGTLFEFGEHHDSDDDHCCSTEAEHACST